MLVGTIANNVDLGLGSYSWTVGSYSGGTALAGSGFRIRIQKPGTDKFDFSNGPFTLTN